MVYTRILFNNIKESTPNFIKTVPYSKVLKPVLGRKPQVAWKMTRDPKYICMMNFIHRRIICNTTAYAILFFAITYGLNSFFFYPGLWLYQSNNRHRQLDYAIEIEKKYKQKKALEEAAEADDEEEEEENDE